MIENVKKNVDLLPRERLSQAALLKPEEVNMLKAIHRGSGEMGHIKKNKIKQTAEFLSDIEFTVYSTDENYIVGQAAVKSGLTITEVKKIINFEYKSPQGFSDEVIESVNIVVPEIITPDEGIQKVKGSVIVTIG